jgi:hypothetical protein
MPLTRHRATESRRWVHRRQRHQGEPGDGDRPGGRHPERRRGGHGGGGHRHLPGSVDRQGRNRLHVGCLEHAFLHERHLGAFNSTPGLGPPSKLAFVQGPSNTTAGVAISPAVKVAVEDANGNVETSGNATTVSLAIGTNPAGGTLSGEAAVTVAAGVATFPWRATIAPDTPAPRAGSRPPRSQTCMSRRRSRSGCSGQALTRARPA